MSSIFKPKRHRGQNFLIDKNILAKIVAEAGFGPDDVVVEVGPGMGVLTEELVRRARRVIAVEIDKELFAHLSEKFADCKNLTLIKDDILDFNPTSYNLQATSYSIVANLPYNITSRFFRKFLEEAAVKPKKMTVLVQREVAKRMTAKPPDMNLLALSVQLFADVRIAFPVSRHCFRPKPKVESSVVTIQLRPDDRSHSRGYQMNESRIKNKESGEIQNIGRNGLDSCLIILDSKRAILALAKAAFSEKRKQCAKTIAKKCGIPLGRVLKAFLGAGIPPTARAEEISLEAWKKVAKILIDCFELRNTLFVIPTD